MVATVSDLSQLRQKIDAIDLAIIKLLGERMQVCREVAEVKAGSATAVIQPQRVREVLTVRRQWAIDSNVDPDFTEQLFRILLAETHRIEIAEERDEPAPSKTAETSGSTLRSALDTVACRIDHVVVAVANLDEAMDFLTSLGFKTTRTQDSAIITADAGGVTVVLVGPGDPGVDAHLAAHGSGVQHIAIEVLNAGFVQQALAEAQVPLLTVTSKFSPCLTHQRVCNLVSSRAPVTECQFRAKTFAPFFAPSLNNPHTSR